MMAPIKKAAGGFKTTTATATHIATDFIAVFACQAGAGAAFHTKPCAGIDRRQYRAVSRRDRIHAGARHTTKQAGSLSENEVFSRSEFMVSGLGVPIRKDGSMACFMCLYPAPPFDLDSQTAGFSVQQGTEIMTITTPKLGNTSALICQQAIENALTTALYFIRLPSTESGLKTATDRAIRAASMLKQACAEIQNGRAA